MTFSWAQIILEALGSISDTGVSSSIRVLRLLRVSRLLRIVKTLWIVRFVGALRTLVSSLLDTLKPLFWAMLLLLLIMYIAGVMILGEWIEWMSIFSCRLLLIQELFSVTWQESCSPTWFWNTPSKTLIGTWRGATH